MEQLLTPEQVSQYLQVHHLTVLRLIKTKKLEAIKIGRMYRISQTALKKFIKTNKT